MSAAKNVPGTPLPWFTWQDPISKTWRIDHKLPNNSIIVCIAVGQEQDARQIIHASNAYPRLVAALKEAMPRIESEYCSHRGPCSADSPHCYTQEYHALLRDLGEL